MPPYIGGAVLGGPGAMLSHILKLSCILKLLFIFSFLAACSDDNASSGSVCAANPDSAECASEKEREAEREADVQAAKAQESQSFASVKDCLAQKGLDSITDQAQKLAIVQECARAAGGGGQPTTA